jgi:hypothetical protein
MSVYEKVDADYPAGVYNAKTDQWEWRVDGELVASLSGYWSTKDEWASFVRKVNGKPYGKAHYDNFRKQFLAEMAHAEVLP